MARWNNIDDTTLDARTIYTGAYGFDDNDALGRVWSRTEKGFERAMRAAIMDTARMYGNEYETASQVRDQIWYVGPFAETVGDVIADMEDASRAGEMRDDIRASDTGYVH